METKAIIKTKHLKDFLSLFDSKSLLNNLALGDTWHPSSGYVDESILNEKHKIKDILEFDYDFKGLVAFEADIENINIVFKNEAFEITGTVNALRSINNKVIELNAYTPGKFQFNYVKEYGNH